MTDKDPHAELLALAEAATPGPWRSVIDDTGGQWAGWPLCIIPEGDDDRSVVRTGGMWPYEWDAKVSQFEAVSTAAFIAAANPSVVKGLITAIQDQQAEIAGLREALSRARTWMPSREDDERLNRDKAIVDRVLAALERPQ